MLDPKLLRTDLVALKDKLATRGYELDVAFWTDVENRAASLYRRATIPKKCRSKKDWRIKTQWWQC